MLILLLDYVLRGSISLSICVQSSFNTGCSWVSRGGFGLRSPADPDPDPDSRVIALVAGLVEFRSMGNGNSGSVVVGE
jgi:hypothetical protein